MKMGKALIAALEKGRGINPNECVGIGGSEATCAIGAMALGLGWEPESIEYNTSTCANWIRSFYPGAPINQIYIINDSYQDGSRDKAVKKFLLGY